MQKRLFCSFIAVFGILIINIGVVSSEIIFSDNYDTHQSDIFSSWSTLVPDGYNHWIGPSEYPETYQGIVHWPGEITYPGRGGIGRSLKQWRHTNTPENLWGTGYEGYLGKSLPYGIYRELYARYYVRIPLGWNVPFGAGTKFNRFYTGNSQNNIGEVSFMVEGPFNSNGLLFIYTPSMGANKETFRTKTLGDLGILDGNWHCLEVHYKLNSPGKNDGVCEIFVDGRTEHGTYDIGGIAPDYYFTDALTPGIGNTGSHFDPSYSFKMTPDEWKAIEFDDYVLSTTYVGPELKILSSPKNLTTTLPK